MFSWFYPFFFGLPPSFAFRRTAASFFAVMILPISRIWAQAKWLGLTFFLQAGQSMLPVSPFLAIS